MIKRNSKKYKKIFKYSLKENDAIVDYSYIFETSIKKQNEKMIRICFDEFVRRHGQDAVDNIVGVKIEGMTI